MAPSESTTSSASTTPTRSTASPPSSAPLVEPQATVLTSVPSGRYTSLRAGSQGIDFDTRGRFAGRRAGSGRGGRLGDDARSRGARGGGEQGRSALPLPEQGGFDRGHDPAPHRGLRGGARAGAAEGDGGQVRTL